MNITNRIIHDLYLDEFLYNLMFHSTRHQRERFPPEFMGVFRTSKNAKMFIAKATMEQKLYFLSVLGVDWFLFCGTKKNATTDLKRIIADFKDNKPAEALNQVTEKKLFIISGDQFIDYMGMMASVTHNKNYSYNVEMMKIGYHLKKWKKDVEYKNYSEVSENKETSEYVIKFALTLFLNGISIESNHSIKMMDLFILLYLYERKFLYVTQNKIYEYFIGFVKKIDVSAAIKRLREIQLISLSSISEAKEYKITTLGINKLNGFIKRVLSTSINE